jgi:hypothetical protein
MSCFAYYIGLVIFDIYLLLLLLLLVPFGNEVIANINEWAKGYTYVKISPAFYFVAALSTTILQAM